MNALSSVCFVLIFSSVVINALNDNKWNLLSECDSTVGKGVAVCFQYFSPIQFVSDIISGNKDSLCCTHFKHNACINGVREALQVAKATNLCPHSLSDSVISTLTDSSINNYVITSCKSFNAGKCVMDSVGDVVNTIQGFFVPQQQKPVISGVIDNIFNRENSYNRNNNNYNNDRRSPLNPFQEVLKTGVTPTQNPLINKSIRDLLDRQYIPEASVLKPIKDMFIGKQTTTTESPLRSLFNGFLNPQTTEESSGFDTSGFDGIRNLFNSNNNSSKSPSFLQSFGDMFGINATNDSSTIVKDIVDSLAGNRS